MTKQVFGEWLVNLDDMTATHITHKIVIKFTEVPDEPGAFDGELIAGGDYFTGALVTQAPRIMREAGDAVLEAMREAN